MLDTRASDLSSLLTDLVGKLVKEGKVEEELKSKVLSVLLYRHQHVQHRHKTSFNFKPFHKRAGSRDDLEVKVCFNYEVKFTICTFTGICSEGSL